MTTPEGARAEAFATEAARIKQEYADHEATCQGGACEEYGCADVFFVLAEVRRLEAAMTMPEGTRAEARKIVEACHSHYPRADNMSVCGRCMDAIAAALSRAAQGAQGVMAHCQGCALNHPQQPCPGIAPGHSDAPDAPDYKRMYENSQRTVAEMTRAHEAREAHDEDAAARLREALAKVDCSACDLALVPTTKRACPFCKDACAALAEIARLTP